jgi:hypothetical protein
MDEVFLAFTLFLGFLLYLYSVQPHGREHDEL